MLLSQHCIDGDEGIRKVSRIHSIMSKLMVLGLNWIAPRQPKNCIAVVARLALETAMSM